MWQFSKLEKQKKHAVSRSHAEAEFRSLAQEVYEGIKISRILLDMDFTPDRSIHLFSDNKLDIVIAHNRSSMTGQNTLK